MTQIISKLCLIGFAALMTACASGPPRHASVPDSSKPNLPAGVLAALPDRASFHQQDPRWAKHTLGGSGEALSSDGCLVTATAMALSNLGFTTNPGDLNARLKKQGGYNRQGWLVWSGIERVTGGRAKARFYKTADIAHVRACLADGFYPLVKFKLPSRRSHWAMVVQDRKNGLYVRDPMVTSTVPIPLSARASGIDAVRCVGVERV
ncbi:MAG: hypothetical protein V3U82_07250 [Robiginitomaculum sp.]